MYGSVTGLPGLSHSLILHITSHMNISNNLIKDLFPKVLIARETEKIGASAINNVFVPIEIGLNCKENGKNISVSLLYLQVAMCWMEN